MNNYPVSKHFKIAELVSRKMLIGWGASCMWFIDPRIITYLEFMRNRFGVTYLNNWIDGGTLDSRGFRSHEDLEGGKFSQHRYGRATDTTFKTATPDEVRADIIKNWSTLYKPLGVACIESQVNWVHVDMRYIPNQTSLLIVTP